MDNSAVLNRNKFETEKTDFRKIMGAEPEWIYNLRKTAWESYYEIPLPERSNHLWRYTDPAFFVPENYEKFLKSDQSESGQSSGGGFLISENESELENKGVIFENLNSAVINHGGIVREYLGRAINADFGKFESLNMALWDKGLFLYVPDNTIINEPVHIRYIPSSDFIVRRMLLVIGENSEIKIIDDYSANGKYIGLLTNGAVEVFAGKNSNVKYMCLNRLEADHALYLTGRAVIDSGVSLESVYAGFGAGISKINTGTILKGKGANSRITGFIFSDGERRTDIHTRQHHMSAESFSNINFKVVLKDKAKSAYTGLIRIEKDAVDCEAYQENRNLLLNEGTKAESIPELEILTDRVRCSHGATMGQIDPETIFFMKSRGISEAKAIRLLIEGFFESTLSRSPEIFKEILADELSRKLKAV